MESMPKWGYTPEVPAEAVEKRGEPERLTGGRGLLSSIQGRAYPKLCAFLSDRKGGSGHSRAI